MSAEFSYPSPDEFGRPLHLAQSSQLWAISKPQWKEARRGEAEGKRPKRGGGDRGRQKGAQRKGKLTFLPADCSVSPWGMQELGTCGEMRGRGCAAPTHPGYQIYPPGVAGMVVGGRGGRDGQREGKGEMRLAI